MMKHEEVVLMAVGDISLGDHPVCISYGVNSLMQRLGFEYPFEKIHYIFKNADIVFGNLETTLSEKGKIKNFLPSIEMRSTPQAIKGLLKSHFNILNVANNHSLQHGKEAFKETSNILQNNGIKILGIKGEDDISCKPVYFKFKNIIFVFLGYAFTEENYYKNELLYAKGNPDRIVSDIKKVRQSADIVICSLHWGEEFINRPSPLNIQLGRKIIDSGCNLILGHHPHVIQGIENYNGGLIFYSLGNFIFDMLWDKNFRSSYIVSLTISKKGVEAFKLIPIYINTQYQPEAVKYEFKKKIQAKINRLSIELECEKFNNLTYKNTIYYIKYEKLNKKNRYKSYLYFLSNIFRYSPTLLKQTLMRTLKRRIEEIKEQI